MPEIVHRIGNYILMNGQEYSYFAGNDYLGLSKHPAVIKSAADALIEYGINVSASRITTGTTKVHVELESLLAEFKGEDDAIVYSSGYISNKILLNAILKNNTAIFTDSNSHPSIIDGVPSNKRICFYNHCDTVHLENLLRTNKSKNSIILTDGIFPLTGEIAPVDEIYLLAQKYGAIIIVDDAHATGVLGKRGRGTLEHFNLDSEENIFQTETMSKAIGAYGGFISSNADIIKRIRLESTLYSASTALPPSLAAAACTSVRLIMRKPELRMQLKKNFNLIRNGIKSMGYLTTGNDTPIIPIYFSSLQSAKSFSESLKKESIIAPAVEYPSITGKFMIRITASSNHTEEQINHLLMLLNEKRVSYEAES